MSGGSEALRTEVLQEIPVMRELLPPRIERSNKGTYGTLLLAAGNVGMCGAALLAAKAAYRAGAGLVAVLSPEENRQILQLGVPEAIYIDYQTQLHLQGKNADAYDAFSISEKLSDMAQRFTAIAMGPGIGTSGRSADIMMAALEEVYALSVKNPALLLDADALNMIAAGELAYDELRRLPLLENEGLVSYLRECDPDGLTAYRDARAGAGEELSLIITPHPGEMARLTGLSVREIMNDPEGVAADHAREHRLICVLKDHRTVVTDGVQTFRNPTGCDGMATGGSGDVLTGVIGGLLAQGCKPLEAARLGVFLHGLAGELAQERLGARSVMAGDIAAYLPEAFCLLERGEQGGNG